MRGASAANAASRPARPAQPDFARRVWPDTGRDPPDQWPCLGEPVEEADGHQAEQACYAADRGRVG